MVALDDEATPQLMEDEEARPHAAALRALRNAQSRRKASINTAISPPHCPLEALEAGVKLDSLELSEAEEARHSDD